MLQFAHLTEDKVIQGTYPHQFRVTMNDGFQNPSPKGENDIFTFHRLFFYLSDESASWVSFETGIEWILRQILEQSC